MRRTDLEPVESSDEAMLTLLRRSGSLGIEQLASAMGVTATAVRQRLNRLIQKGWIEKSLASREDNTPATRGRPGHVYRLTDRGQRAAGDNFGDLAMAMWKEIRSIKDPAVRKGLLERLATAMAEVYGKQVSGNTAAERMESISQLLRERGVPFSVENKAALPMLVAEVCPYPGLPEQDRSLCAMERMLFSKLVAQDVRLTGCRLDGAPCCTFEMS